MMNNGDNIEEKSNPIEMGLQPFCDGIKTINSMSKSRKIDSVTTQICKYTITKWTLLLESHCQGASVGTHARVRTYIHTHKHTDFDVTTFKTHNYFKNQL